MRVARIIICLLVAVLILSAPIGFAVTEIPDGAYGVWKLPDLGTTTPVYRQTNDNGQWIVDQPNSGLIIDYAKGRLILDHSYSVVGGGVWNIREVKVDSKAYLITEDRTEEYICYMVCRADAGGVSYMAGGDDIIPHSETEVLCSCCANSDGSEVYVASFKLVW